MAVIDYTCPMCGEKFKYPTQFSYTTFGCNLDFKPFGAAEIPTPLPKCPKCNFVFFEETFKKTEIDQLKKLLQKNNIFEIEPDMPNYYYLAKESELLGKDINGIIYYYLSAIWENDNSNNDLFIKLSGILFNCINEINRENENYFIYQLIKIDLLRRSKRFSDANELIEKLMLNNDDFPNKYIGVLDYQWELLKKKDIGEHEMPAIDE
jgi:hypothetical protein